MKAPGGNPIKFSLKKTFKFLCIATQRLRLKFNSNCVKYRNIFKVNLVFFNTKNILYDLLKLLQL